MSSAKSSYETKKRASVSPIKHVHLQKVRKEKVVTTLPKSKKRDVQKMCEKHPLYRSISLVLDRAAVKYYGKSREKRGTYITRAVPINMANHSCHWSIKSEWTRAWKASVAIAFYKNKSKFGVLPLQDKPQIIVQFFHVKQFDKDGMYNAAKPVVDGIKDLGIIKDDSTKHIDLIVKQKKVRTSNDEITIITINTKQATI